MSINITQEKSFFHVHCVIIECKYGGARLEPIEIARRAVSAAADKQANDILLLDVHEICSFADYFVLCNGESNRQIEAIRDEIVKSLKKDGIIANHEEGTVESGWILLDYGPVIIHIFEPVERDYYQLEQLWDKAPVLVHIQ